jgi:hypothetical protein
MMRDICAVSITIAKKSGRRISSDQPTGANVLHQFVVKFFLAMSGLLFGLPGCVQMIEGPQIHEKSLGNLIAMESHELFIFYGEVTVEWRKNKLKSELLNRGFSHIDLEKIELGAVIGMSEGAAFASFGRPVHKKTTLLETEIHKKYTFRISSKGHFDYLKVLVVNGIIIRIDR